ncbi:MAG: ATP:cob(I)alamin adenosyltransferase [Gammaproteobacteria bacterium RIFCSPHIGHO2_12_FULL_43_28]|nr:MAG: ATP:cob(I)alamin adenosyltransferase [Gammaproteobacteria bacterium RIFCSPHIGHO2_12_FULL_43_28]
MPYRLTKIYTRKGDDGYTSLRDERLPKDDLLVEAIGTIDELNANIGFTLALSIENTDIINALTQIQHDLFDLGGELHLPQHPIIHADKVKQLETTLDQWNSTLAPLKEFILPGGNLKAAACHMARTVCRRAERTLVKLHRQTPLSNTEILRYLNRLSDVLFVAARMLAKESNAKEVLWEHER